MQIDPEKFGEFFERVVDRSQEMVRRLEDEATEFRKDVEGEAVATEIVDDIIERAKVVAAKFDDAVATRETDSNKAIDLWREAEAECKEIEDELRKIKRHFE